MVVELIGRSLKGIRTLAENQGATPVGPEYWDGVMWSVPVKLPGAR